MQEVGKGKSLRFFKKNESGSTAIEYGMICAFIVLAIMASLPGLGAAVVEMFQKLTSALTSS